MFTELVREIEKRISKMVKTYFVNSKSLRNTIVFVALVCASTAVLALVDIAGYMLADVWQPGAGALAIISVVGV